VSGQLNYSYNMREALEGARVDSGAYDCLSYLNPSLAQISTLTVGGTASDGDYVTTFTPSDGGAAVTITVTRATTPSTNTNLATAIAAAINASSAMLGVASASSASAVVTVTFRRPGITYTITTTAPGTGTLVAATTQATGGGYVRVGKFVARNTSYDRQLTPIISSTTIATVVGVAERTGQIINGESFGLTYDAYRPGDEISVIRAGRVWMIAGENVTPASTPYVWVDHTDTTHPVGTLVAAASGGKAVSAATICRVLSTATAGNLASVEMIIS
jgi:hypothetical protein